MCPACMASAGVVVGSIISAGGVTTIVTRVWRKKKSENNDSKMKEQSYDNGNE